MQRGDGALISEAAHFSGGESGAALSLKGGGPPGVPAEDGRSRQPVLSVPRLWKFPKQAFTRVQQGSSEYTLSSTRSREINQVSCMKERPNKLGGFVLHSKHN